MTDIQRQTKRQDITDTHERTHKQMQTQTHTNTHTKHTQTQKIKYTHNTIHTISNTQ